MLQLDKVGAISPEELFQFVDSQQSVGLAPSGRERIKTSCGWLRHTRRGQRIYGVDTGLGALVSVSVGEQWSSQLQENLVRSHAVGFPPYLEERLSRATLLCRLLVLAKGYSGVTPELLDRLMLLFNSGVAPAIPAQGSLGASGDLGPLASMALLTLGEGFGFYEGVLLPGKEIHRRLGVVPLRLKPKEGLSLINGTSAMLAVGSKALLELREAFALTLLGSTLLLATGRQSTEFLDDEALSLRPHPFVRSIAKIMRELLAGVPGPVPERLQPVYSFRVTPFLFGSIFEALASLENTLTIELGAVSDNPLVFEDRAYHGAHFHGIPLSLALDRTAVVAPHLSGLIDRQLDFVLDGRNHEVVSPFLAVDVTKGQCGLEGAQYLATSLHIENVSDAPPLSVHSLPTNGGNQDLVSLGLQSAIRLRRIARRCHQAVSVQLLAGAQAATVGGRISLSGCLGQVLRCVQDKVNLPYDDSVGMQCVLEAIEKSYSDLKSIVEPMVKRIAGDNNGD